MQSTASELTVKDVETLPYVTLLARLGESNRPPGGIDTIRKFILNCHIHPQKHLLHAGCNAGFSSREIVRLSGCTAIGIDISPDMAEKADLIARADGLEERLRYRQADMRDLPFDDHHFDVTFSAGALAFVEGHPQAIEQWIRVTKPYGLRADAELYYRESPPASIRNDVAEIIGVEVPGYDAGYWPNLFSGPFMEPYYDEDARVKTRGDEEIVEYVRLLLNHMLPEAPEDVAAALRARLVETFRVFNANLEYMNYKIIVRRRLPPDAEPALYG